MIFAIIMTVFLSITMFGCGYLFVKHPPKTINDIYGYRTTMSKKNQDTWYFAHHYAGKVWMISGIINAAVALILIFSLRNTAHFTNIFMPIIIYVQIVILFLVLPITEWKLHKVFDKNGNRK
jgi:uncharacterized membrane protein